MTANKERLTNFGANLKHLCLEQAVERTNNTSLAKVAVQCSADTFVVNHPDSYRDGSPHKSRRIAG